MGILVRMNPAQQLLENKKQYLISLGWTCGACSSCGTVDCLNNQYKDYMIKISSSLAKIFLNGRVVAAVALYGLQKAMKQNNLIT